MDLPWLVAVLGAMGVDPDLVSLISDLVHGCSTRVQINGAYSKPYPLAQGVRQGDPLSCLLYNFSIEPMGMAPREVVWGISTLGLPPAKLIQFADDMNLFLTMGEDMVVLRATLQSASLAIGSKFNYEKTDVLQVGSPAHRSTPVDDPRYETLLACFDRAFILPPQSPLWVLGVWVGSTDRTAARWAQVSMNISKIIRQWNTIGASFQNRVLLAKALLMSRCYYLLDGNGAPLPVLKQISQKILHFVWGRFSMAPYTMLSAPLEEGGIDCLSLAQRRLAYDAKFFADLVSRPHKVAWKWWTTADLIQASSHTQTKGEPLGAPLNPLLQHAHVTLKRLEPRVRLSL